MCTRVGWTSSRSLRFLAARLREHRRRIGSRWRRLPAGRQALPTLAHLRNGTTYARIATGFQIGTHTACRYLREAVDLPVKLAPTLAEAMKTASTKALVILDGTLLPIDRIAADRPFYSGKHKKHGMNVQVITDPAGRLLWASPALPGAVHDVRASRTHGIIGALTEAGRTVLGRQGIPRRGRHHTRALLGPLGDSARRPASRQPLTRENPRTRRTGHRHPQELATPAQAAMLHHPHHRPRPGRPHPPSSQLRRTMKKSHCPRARCTRCTLYQFSIHSKIAAWATILVSQGCVPIRSLPQHRPDGQTDFQLHRESSGFVSYACLGAP